jgi:malonyl-CoA/methylmalonyl-CoA synthetase
LPEEALYFLNKTNASYLLVEPNTTERAVSAKRHAEQGASQKIDIIPIRSGGLGSGQAVEMEIDEDIEIPASSPCLIVFTSGTTGKPKGVVLPRKRFYFCNQLDPDDLYLAYRAVHWIGGAVPLFTTVLQGGRLYSMKRPVCALAVEMWEIFKQGRINVVSLAPALYNALQKHYLSHIRHLPKEEHDLYLDGVSKFRLVMNSGSALDPSTAQFWRELANLPIRNAYAATELGGAAMMTPPGCQYIDVCWV